MDKDRYEYSVRTTMAQSKMYMVETVMGNSDLDRLMELGWIIISSWIQEPKLSWVENRTLNIERISFRLGRGDARMIVTANITVPIPDEILPNIDADEPGSVSGIVPNYRNELWLMRAAAIWGYGTGSGGGTAGSTPPSPSPEFSILGLDIEVSCHARKGKFPLPHDEMISICISNAAWYEGKKKDLCYCLYSFGKCSEMKLEDGRNPIVIKVPNSTRMCEMAYDILEKLSPDIVNIHNGFGFDLKRIATHLAHSSRLKDTTERRRLGNSRSGVHWRLPNGTVVLDSMYDVDKYLRSDWHSISLANMSKTLGLPPKLDGVEMMVENTDDYDVTEMLRYNVRDSDLHALLVSAMKTPQRLFALAGTSRSTFWDAIAGNSGIMVYCYSTSVALSMGMTLDMSTVSGSDEREFEGGFVMDPKPGCYKGVVVIDGNSLYGSIMSKLGIYIDTCVSSVSLQGIAKKLSIERNMLPTSVKINDVMAYGDMILMRDETEYMCIKRRGRTLLSLVLDELIKGRAKAKSEKKLDVAAGYKVLTVSAFGATASKHGVISSKTCAKIVTYCARFYMRLMAKSATDCGFDVIYGDTDSIFVHVKGETEEQCMERANKVMDKIRQNSTETVFSEVGADVKGNYQSIVISSKKKYEAVRWDSSLETKGLAIVKKDTIPIAKYSLSKVMNILNDNQSESQKIESLIRVVGRVMSMVQDGSIDPKYMVGETKISGQPHYVFVDKSWKKQQILIDYGVKPQNVNTMWVAKRIQGTIDSVLVAIGLPNVSQLIFSYNMRQRVVRESERVRRIDGTLS